MSERSLAIIGGGLAGLSAGIYARKNGYETHIFEHHALPGGACAAWKRRGYTIDGCIHWLMGTKPGSGMRQIYEEVGALNGLRLIPVTHYGRFVDETSGLSLDLVANLDRMAQDMKAISPKDAARVDEIVTGAKAFMNWNFDPRRAPQLMGFFEALGDLWKNRTLMRYAIQYFSPINKYAEKFDHPFLQKSIAHAFTPQMPTLNLLILLGLLAAGDLAVPEGGSEAFVRSMLRTYTELGGQFHPRSPVSKILVERDKAVGLRLEDGEIHRADVVLSAADGRATLFGMLEGKYLDSATRKRYERWPIFEPVVLVSFGVARAFSGEVSSRTVFLDEPFTVAGESVPGFHVRIMNYDPGFAPDGHTVIQVMFESPFDCWETLWRDRPRYELEKARAADHCLNRLEAHFPGLRSQVEVTDVATPMTMWRYTRNHKGAYQGWQMTPEALKTRLPKRLKGLENFYMTGQWVEPGGGVPTALFSGRQVVQILCAKEKKPFVSG